MRRVLAPNGNPLACSDRPTIRGAPRNPVVPDVWGVLFGGLVPFGEGGRREGASGAVRRTPRTRQPRVRTKPGGFGHLPTRFPGRGRVGGPVIASLRTALLGRFAPKTPATSGEPAWACPKCHQRSVGPARRVEVMCEACAYWSSEERIRTWWGWREVRMVGPGWQCQTCGWRKVPAGVDPARAEGIPPGPCGVRGRAAARGREAPTATGSGGAGDRATGAGTRAAPGGGRGPGEGTVSRPPPGNGSELERNCSDGG